MLKRFLASGFRSLRDVQLDLGRVNVFYGPNSAGKSNILEAIECLCRLLPLAVDTVSDVAEEALTPREAGQQAARWLRMDDFSIGKQPLMEFEGVFADPDGTLFSGLRFQAEAVTEAAARVSVSHVRDGGLAVRLLRCRVNDHLTPLLTGGVLPAEARQVLRRLTPSLLTHLGVVRTLGINGARGAGGEGQGDGNDERPDGDVIRALFQAKNAPQPEARRRYQLVLDSMQRLLGRGRCDVFQDPRTGRLELREQLPEPNPEGLDLPIDHAGYGEVHEIAILTKILLSGAPMVAVEEPEAHLHAPTQGRLLRALLLRLLEEGRVRQYFIATHSNLFDLDPDGYFDVSLDPATRSTAVVRRPLPDLDGRHLYEPGPAKHALAQLLRYAPEAETVFRRPDGSPVSAAEMLKLLQEDDALAVDFLNSLHGAALRIVRLDARQAREGR